MLANPITLRPETMAKTKTVEGSAFVRYFGPLLDALRELGGSGTADEVIERIASDLKLPDASQNELMPSGKSRFRNQVHWARFYLAREVGRFLQTRFRCYFSASGTPSRCRLRTCGIFAARCRDERIKASS